MLALVFVGLLSFAWLEPAYANDQSASGTAIALKSDKKFTQVAIQDRTKEAFTTAGQKIQSSPQPTYLAGSSPQPLTAALTLPPTKGDERTGATIGDIAQIASSLASFFTLIFLARQTILLRRQTESLEQSVRGQTYQEIVSNYCEINKSLVTDDKLAATFEALESDVSTKSVEVERRKRWLTYWLLNHYENAFMQQRLGSLPSAFWAGIEADCLDQLRKPYVAKIWSTSQNVFSPDFRSFITTKLAQKVTQSTNSQME